MLALIGAVFVASLFGSMHCAGMCGAFVAFAVGSGQPATSASRTALNMSYNLGRLFTYLALGTVAGALGGALDLGASMVGIQRAAAILAGALMILVGVIAVLRSSGVRIPRAPLPPFMTRLAMRAHARAFGLPPMARAAAVGLLTTLLPCGWLYAFVIAAAGTGGALTGALTMAVFWAGTLPVLMTLGLGIQSLTGPLRRRLPMATAILLVLVGTYTVAARAMSSSLPALNRTASVQDAVRTLESNAQTASESCPFCDKHGR